MKTYESPSIEPLGGGVEPVASLVRVFYAVLAAVAVIAGAGVAAVAVETAGVYHFVLVWKVKVATT